MDDDEDDDDMHDDGDDSFGDDGDDEMLDEGTELTTQLAAAGWQHGVVFCFVNTLSQVKEGARSCPLICLSIYNLRPKTYSCRVGGKDITPPCLYYFLMLTETLKKYFQ